MKTADEMFEKLGYKKKNLDIIFSRFWEEWKNDGFIESIDTDFFFNLTDIILSDYKRVLKENERYQKSDYETICLENNELREITDRIQSEYNDLLKDNFRLKNELETKRKEYQETYKDVREELRELKKVNEELRFEERRRAIGEYGTVEIHDVINRTLSNDYIPTQKVKDKIEEIQKDKDSKYYDMFLETRDIEYVVEILQELLRK